MTEQWQTIEAPRGAYISWGSRPGQEVTGAVLTYSATGGTDANDRVCPQLSLELVAPAFSVNRHGERSDFPAGELVVLNCGLVSLKRLVQAAALEPGDLVKISFISLSPTPKGDVKEFDVKVARGAGKSTAAANRPAAPAAPTVPAQAPGWGPGPSTPGAYVPTGNAISNSTAPAVPTAAPPF